MDYNQFNYWLGLSILGILKMLPFVVIRVSSYMLLDSYILDDDVNKQAFREDSFPVVTCVCS
jgi:hypothetical protein